MERVHVGGLLVRARRRDGLQILLGKRAPSRASYPGVWDVLGGRCEPGETPEQTLIRELVEETGVRPTEWRPLGVYRGAVPGDESPVVLHLFVVTAWTGTPRNRQPEEHTQVAWFTVEDACRLRLADPAYRRVFRRLASAG
jgi:8-oxo-dGTP pyrophosphatase MutT (NUDIX family)